MTIRISKKPNRASLARTNPDVRYVIGGAYGDDCRAVLERAGRGWRRQGTDEAPRTIREIRAEFESRPAAYPDDFAGYRE